MQTRAVSDAALPATDFGAWLPRWLELNLAQKFEHGSWFVLIEDFDISGMGATPDDARDEAFSLLGAYLHAHFEDGTPFEQTFRPIPRRLRVTILAGKTLHRLWPERKRPDEQRTLVTPKSLLAC